MDTTSIKNLFDKYILIWIWSIFVSIDTALSYNIFNLYDSAKWQKLNLFLIPFYFFAMTLAVASWLALFNFFRTKILSLILNEKTTIEDYKNAYENNSFEYSEKENQDKIDAMKRQLKQDLYASKQLRSAFYYIILAIFVRFLIPIVEMLFSAFYNN